MSTEHPSYAGTPSRYHGMLRSEIDATLALPDPDETWTRNDKEIADALDAKIEKFAEWGVIELVERRGTRNPNRWRTNAAVISVRDQLEKTVSRTPCGHTGVRNLGDGVYSCTREDCDATFGREIAREVL